MLSRVAALTVRPGTVRHAVHWSAVHMVKSRVSYISRGATVAWGPTSQTAGLLAAGTVAGAISESFDASAALEIFSLDLGSGSGEMPVLGSVQLPERFHSLAWGTGGSDNGSLPHGMLAGGMVDGTVKVFNPAAIADSGDVQLASLERHKGGVRALEFNPGMPNLLASGAGESEVLITDLTKPSAPNFYSPGATTGGTPADSARGTTRCPAPLCRARAGHAAMGRICSGRSLPRERRTALSVLQLALLCCGAARA